MSGFESFPLDAVAAAAGCAPVAWEVVATRGYARSSAHWRVAFDDGQSSFVKHALTPDAVTWLRTERLIYEAVRQPFMPRFLGACDEGDVTLIVLEDLTEAEWPPPWSRRRIDAVLSSLDAVRRTPPPEGIESLEAMRPQVVGWPDVAANPEPLLSTGLCTREWLQGALPTLLQAGSEAPLEGSELLHLDVRSDNLCFRDEQAVLVDWNLARVGNADYDIAFWLPSLTLEGGPSPWEVLPDAGLLAAAVAGFFSARAGLPPPVTAPTVREFQRAQAEIALRWAAQELGLQAVPG